jgi:hypothetical protein
VSSVFTTLKTHNVLNRVVVEQNHTKLAPLAARSLRSLATAPSLRSVAQIARCAGFFCFVNSEMLPSVLAVTLFLSMWLSLFRLIAVLPHVTHRISRADAIRRPRMTQNTPRAVRWPVRALGGAFCAVL